MLTFRLGESFFAGLFAVKSTTGKLVTPGCGVPLPTYLLIILVNHSKQHRKHRKVASTLLEGATMKYSGRYVAENEGGNGICKVLVDKKYRKVIGVSAIGNYSSEFIYGASFMIEMEMTVDDIKEIVFPHPTVCEVIREALFAF